ncbi:MAG TPA: M20/M25/M40 family metallo-hydrolase [Rhodanobacter sp.]|nr:M20/M25/M40 family metallo-hydrolase [Rhodanobacter sp.]
MKKQLSYVCVGAGLALLAACSSGTQEASSAAGTPTDAASTATPPKPDAAVTAKPGTLDATMAMLKRSIAFQSATGHGEQTIAYAHYLADALESAGFAKSDIEVVPIDGIDKSAALVLRWKGSTDAKPILINAHMDVVAADADRWTHPPFELAKEGDYLYGRGVADMKNEVVVLVQTLMRLKKEGYAPKRGLIVILTGDEETDFASARTLAPKYKDVEYVLDAEGGGGTYSDDLKPELYRIGAAEKLNVDYLLTATGPGGHSSAPLHNNPLYTLSRALARVEQYQFPVTYNEITLASFKGLGEHVQGPLGAAMKAFAANPKDAKAAATLSGDPAYVGQLRTTCVGTTMESGHALNAIPKQANANINCRVWPGVSPDDIKAQLAKVIDDPAVKITIQDPQPVVSQASPIVPELFDVIAASIRERFPGVDVVPSQGSGASDNQFFRNEGLPAYGVTPFFSKPNDNHAHGIDERILAGEFQPALDFWYSLTKKLTAE